MKIYLVPMFYKNKDNAEKAIFIYEQAKALINAGHNVIVLAVNPVERTYYKKNNVEYINDDGIDTYYISFPCELCSNYNFSNIYIEQYIIHLEQLFSCVEQNNGRADVIYAHFSLIAGYAATVIAKRRKYPIVIEEHHSRILTEQLAANDIRILKETVKNSTEFICVSNTLKSAIINKIGHEKSIHVVSNMIDDSFRYYHRSNKSIFRFFSLGNLFYRKGFDILIDAFFEEFSTNKSVELVIGGSGPEGKNLKKQISRLSDKANIQLIGHLDRAQTINEYKECDCFVLPSRCESFGLVYREAMAIGRPIITTNHGGFSDDEWNDTYGIMINVDEKEQLKKALRQIHNQYNNYNLKHISDDCLKLCSSNVVINQIIGVLKSTI